MRLVLRVDEVGGSRRGGEGPSIRGERSRRKTGGGVFEGVEQLEVLQALQGGLVRWCFILVVLQSELLIGHAALWKASSKRVIS